MNMPPFHEALFWLFKAGIGLMIFGFWLSFSCFAAEFIIGKLGAP